MRTSYLHAHACLPALELKIQSGNMTGACPAFDAMESPPPIHTNTSWLQYHKSQPLKAVFSLFLWTFTTEHHAYQPPNPQNGISALEHHQSLTGLSYI
jgi:hypothetical protein